MALVDFKLGEVGSIFKDIREAVTGTVIEDPVKQAEIDLKFKTLEQELVKGQQAINLQEAKHPSIYVAGWRPFIGWVCGVSLAYSFALQPLLDWSISVYYMGTDVVVNTPKLETGGLMNLVVAMLGMGALRTYEKKNKLAREQLK